MNRQQIRKGIKSTVKRVTTNYKRYFIGRDWRRFAEKYTKKKSLSPEQKKAILERYRPFKKVSCVFHEYYTEKTGTFCVNYMPDDLYYNYIDRFYNDWDMATFFDNKCYYTTYFRNIKHPGTVALRMNGMWFNADRELINHDELSSILLQEPEVFIKKATESDGGHGVFYLDTEGIRQNAMDIVSAIDGELIIQQPIKQHERLGRFNDKSVNSIRVLTLLTEDGVKVYSCLLRIGVNGARVDNSSSGGVSCGIDANGRLKKYSYSNFGDRFEKHPGTDMEYLGYEIPGFSRVTEAAKALACQLPYFRLVSWDFSVDTDGDPVLIEANLKYGGMDFHQLNNGPLFGDDADKILAEVFSNRKS